MKKKKRGKQEEEKRQLAVEALGAIQGVFTL